MSRARLSDLASKHLPPTTLRELGIGSSTPLDSKALETYTALLEHGIPVPKALYPGQRPLLLSFNVSCQFGGFLLAQALFDNGLCELNATFNGVTPLAGIFPLPDADGQKENMIRWFLERGSDPTFPSPMMMPNFLFYLASVYESEAVYRKSPLFSSAIEIEYGLKRTIITTNEVKELNAAVLERKTTPSMIALVAQFCNPVQRDSCRCSCSLGGCLPLHKFRNGIALDSQFSRQHPRTGWIPKRWTTVSDTIRSWIHDCHMDESQAREYLRDACRLEVFTRLGMAQTCCIFEGDHGQFPSGFPTRQERDPETCRELEDEDAELRKQLEAIMEAYDKALEMCGWRIDEFWDWWWSTVQRLLPEMPAEQRRRMHGDYKTWLEVYLEDARTFPPEQRWDFWNIYDDADRDAGEHAPSAEVMDFMDEIKQYFANILSQDPFRGNHAKENSQDEGNATTDETGPPVSQ
jgi:hypothetical protein